MSGSIQSLYKVAVVTALTLLLAFSGCSRAAKKARILERADRYFKAGQYDKAKIEYLNLVQVDRQNVHAFQQLGFIWSEQGAPLPALPFLLKVGQVEPENIATRSKLALALMALHQPADARREALAILEKDPVNPDAITLVADTSDTKDEIAESEQVIEKFPNKTSAAYHLARAGLASRKGDLGAASDEVQQALAVEPKSARAHLVMGYMYLVRKNPAHARPEFKTAAELAPARSEERIKYAEFQEDHGAPADARAILQGITKEAPDYLPAWHDLAQIALAEKKYDEAISFLDNILSRNPENAEARILEAQVCLGKGDSAKAINILNGLNGISVFQNSPNIKYQLGRAYVMKNNLPQATAALEQAISAKPDYAEAILLLAELNLRAGKFQSVVNALEELRNKRPDLPQARILLADAYRGLGRGDEATALFSEQLKATPESAGDHFLLGVLLRQQKKNDEARAEFQKAFQLAPEKWRSIDQLVEMDLIDRHFDAATERVQDYFQKWPNDPAGHYMLGKIHGVQQHWSEAESEFHKTIERDPNFGPAYELLVSAYVAQNKLNEALTELEVSARQHPNDPRPVMMMALLYGQLKEYPKARDAYEKVVALKPDMVAALNNLAYIDAELLPNLDRAYELAQKARTLQPDEPSIGDTLGWILFKRGDYQQALTILQDSAGKLPQNPVVQFHLGMAAYMMGQTDVARIALAKAAHATVAFPGKDEAERRLASLQGSSGHATPEPNDIIAVTRLAESYEEKGDPAQAAAAYEQALKLNSKVLGIPLKLAQLYVGPLHNPDKAITFARKARDLAPNDAKVAATLGRIAFQAGNYTWSYSLLNEAVRQGNNDPAVLHDFAMATYPSGRVTDARQIMQRIVTDQPAAPQSEDAKKFLALTALEQPSAEVVSAQAEVEKILKAQPNYAPALMAQAAIQLQRNDPSAAATTYSQVLQKYPDFAPAQKRLADIYADSPDQLTKAYELAMKARKTLPDDTELARTLAELCFQRKEFSYAIQLFQQSATKQPLSSKELYYLGMAQLQTRQETKGRETLQRALASGLQDPFAQEARKHLAEPQ